MTVDSLFRKRMRIPANEDITFDKLEYLLEKTAKILPFENLSVIENRNYEITKESLINKILGNNEGGLCYELNPILYYFLIENGFNAVLVRGNVYNNDKETFQQLGRTHVTILVSHQGRIYLVDTGFGSNLPLKPVPLTGKSVISRNGEFRIREINNDHGNYMLQIKIKHKHTEWKNGYAFLSNKPIKSISELNEVQTTIFRHQESPFNKSPLFSFFTTNGRKVLTNTHITQWMNGVMTKEKTENKNFKEVVKQHFGNYR
ncbi:arylamine N-acetyltransferase [Oceanobacillus sp. FSL K6-2867]|uniref:arylamine N-acetyltransferase family protein n=1 Tax=Oceanobacillus sp. FSL K6-2867 TaxID=2954748 RepID=UPI0030DB6960